MVATESVRQCSGSVGVTFSDNFVCAGLGECVGTCPNSGQMPLGVYRVCGTCGVDANNVQTFVDHATYKCVSVCPAGFIATNDDKVATLHALSVLCRCWLSISLYAYHARCCSARGYCREPELKYGETAKT